MSVNNVKGTRDIIGEEANAFNYIENLLIGLNHHVHC